MMPVVLETSRLILRTWKAEDAEDYYKINQDPKVIEFLPGSLTMAEVRAFMDKMNERFFLYGYTLWAAKLKRTREFMGFIGLNYIDWEAPFKPKVEIGWRLGSAYWGQGYAPEGARAALTYGFENKRIQEIVAFTAFKNKRSIRVMEKIGLQRDKEGGFHHPKLPTNHPLSYHVLYRLKVKKLNC